MARHANPDAYFAAVPRWREELTALRALLRETELEETLKWGAPVYVLGGKNVVGIGAFQSYFGLWFFQGALLKDEQERLVNAQEGKTKAQRQLRFTESEELDEDLVRAYVAEAVDLARRGVEIRPERDKPVEVPPELESALDAHAAARRAFDALTPGKRREYADYVASAVRETTKERRLAKILPMIEAGVGLNDRYRNC